MGDDESVDIIALLKSLRLAKGMSQARVGEIAGFSTSAIHQWEKKERDPKYFDLLAWCQVLGIRLEPFDNDTNQPARTRESTE